MSAMVRTLLSLAVQAASGWFQEPASPCWSFFAFRPRQVDHGMVTLRRDDYREWVMFVHPRQEADIRGLMR